VYTFLIISAIETEGATEPVSLDEIKAWCEVDYPDKDDLLTAMGKGARKTIEGITNRKLVEYTVTFDVETTCAEMIPLPYAGSVSEMVVNKLDCNDDPTTLESGSDYFVRGNTLRIPYGGRYSVSYKTVPDVPEDVKEAIKMEVAERFANRGENSGELSKSALNKLQPHIVTWL
jgi:hypothetical protein